ncbi:glycosyltransferase [Methanobrevibacter sp.]|uniref:glycosyltransferase n=1 Tax=Methanobrevibacter sp. TaxID=66852 RepID=UPI00386D5F5C
MNYKISIIVPVFNMEKYIERSFESIRSQTFGFSNLEVIFVDDCSTDRSPQIIDDYSSEFENVSAYHLEENSGFPGKPRNVGIDKATADYVMFLDSDDLLDEDACKRLYEQVRDKDEIDMVLGGYTNVYSDGRRLSQVPGGFKGIYPDSTEVNMVPEDRQEVTVSNNPQNDFNLFSLSASISARLFRRELLTANDIYYEVGIPSEDAIFVYDVLINSRNVTVLNDYSVYNRIVRSEDSDKSTSFDVDYSFIMKLLKAYNIISDKCDNNEIDEYVQPVVFAKMLKYFLNRLNNSGVRKEDVDVIVASEDYTRFRNREFIKSHAEFNIAFENIHNLENNFKYSIFLKSAVINKDKNRKRIKALERKSKNMTAYYERQLNHKIEYSKRLEEWYQDMKANYKEAKQENSRLNGDIDKLNAEIEKLKSSIEKLNDDRKAFTEK